MAKKALSALLESALGRWALNVAGPAARRLQARRPNQLQVLTYHDVTDAATFETHMSYVAENYDVVCLNDVLEAFMGRRALPSHALLITFDDAYRSFAACAWPALRRYGLPVTMFVATAFPDAPENIYWWDRLEDALKRTARRDTLASPAGRLSLASEKQRREALKRLKEVLWQMPPTELLAWVYEICGRLQVGNQTAPGQSRVMGWDELRRLKSESVTLAPHSRTHPDMSRISRQEARQEIAGSLADLQRETGPVPPVFAYPGGHYNQETVEALAQENFLLGFATLRGTNDVDDASRGAGRWQLRRNHIGDGASLAALQTRLLYGSRFLNRWHSLRKHRKGYES